MQVTREEKFFYTPKHQLIIVNFDTIIATAPLSKTHIEKRIRPKVINTLIDLHVMGYQLAILSNRANISAEFIHEDLKPLEIINPKIFTTLPKALNENTATCLFIDDNEANIKAAKALGFYTLQFNPEQSLFDQLAKSGVLFCPTPKQTAASSNVTSLFSRHGNEIHYANHSAVDQQHLTTHNFKKHDQYISLLSRLGTNPNARPYWEKSYQKLNEIILSDYQQRKDNPARHAKYFNQLIAALNKALGLE